MEKDNRANRYSPETRARAVRMVFDHIGSEMQKFTRYKKRVLRQV